MSNLQFEYQSSISINALTLLCNEIDQFDHHKKGIQLCDFLSIKLAQQIKRTDVQGGKKVNRSINSTSSKLAEPTSEEKDAMQELYKTRQQIKEAINADKIQIDEFDTKDCNEIRLEVEGAAKWLRTEFDISLTQIHSKDWRQDKKDNTLLAINSLAKLVGEDDSFSKTADRIVEQLNVHGVEKDEQTFANLISDAMKYFNKKAH